MLGRSLGKPRAQLLLHGLESVKPSITFTDFCVMCQSVKYVDYINVINDTTPLCQLEMRCVNGR